MKKILIGCEFSGIVRDMFIAEGFNAISCDLPPTERPGPHIQGDVLDVLNDGWDAAIFFPPCTYLCSSGLHWNKRIPGRSEKTESSSDFVKRLLSAPIEKIALENPVGCISTRIRKPDQIIQPYNFGHNASKKTCLWLKNLPPLVTTRYIEPKPHPKTGRLVWGNQTGSGQNKLGPATDRWKYRSETYTGIARAMASQWGPIVDKF